MSDPASTDGQTDKLERNENRIPSPLKLSLLRRVRNAWLKVLILVTSHILGALQTLAKIDPDLSVSPAASR